MKAWVGKDEKADDAEMVGRAVALGFREIGNRGPRKIFFSSF